MKDEIKEMLDDLLFTTTLPNVSVKLSEEKLNQLKNYITNLQERNEKAIEYIKEDMYSEPNELYGLVDGEHLLNILQGEDKDE